MYLLDTNIISELRKVRAGKADARVAEWANSVEASDLYLSVITLQELAIGVLLAERRNPAQGARLRTWFERQLLPAFDGRVLHVGGPVALRSAPLHVPNPHPVRDGLIEWNSDPRGCGAWIWQTGRGCAARFGEA